MIGKNGSASQSAGHIILVTHARGYRNSAFVQAADRLGIRVTPAIDMDPALADRWQAALGLDFSNPEAAAAGIAAYAALHPVDAVLAVDDKGTLVAARAAELLGLPHNDPDAALAASNKLAMRRRMDKAGVPCPWFKPFQTTDDVAELGESVPYPCVIKPLDLNGSRGVMRADTPAQLAQVARRLTAILASESQGRTKHEFLVESFIPGQEVALEGLLNQGRLSVLALFDKPDPLDGPFFEETIYVTPSRHPPEVQRAIQRCVEDAAGALGLQTGPVHAELRINDEGPWMLEIAGRSIGGLCSRTLRFGVNRSLEELILSQACGLPMEIQREDLASGVMMIPIPEAGILQNVDGVERARAVPGIKDVEITARLNYSIRPLPEGESYLGFIFAKGERPEDVEEALRIAHAKLQFTILPEFVLS